MLLQSDQGIDYRVTVSAYVSEGESSLEFVEQLGPVGLPHDIDVQSLFDPTGTGS